MNQATNKTAYGLMKSEPLGFCEDSKLKGMYEIFGGEDGWMGCSSTNHFSHENVYRLKILPDEWYYCELDTDHGIADYIFKGHSLKEDFSNYTVLRPITTSEIPERVFTLKDRIEEKYPDKRVELLMWEPDLCIRRGDVHTEAQSMKGFSGYVYEELYTFEPLSNDRELKMFINPVKYGKTPGSIELPVAVLFEK